MNTQQQLEAMLSALNALCQSGERYTLIRQARRQYTPAGLLRRGYYLVYRSAEGEACLDTPWWDQAGEGQFIATNAQVVMAHLRALLREREPASEVDRPATHELGNWWQTRSRSLERQRQRRRRS